MDNQPRSSYSSIRNKKIPSRNDYGINFFRVLYIIILILGSITALLSIFSEDYFHFLLTAGIGSILFSFLFKFMSSNLSLLKKIKEK